VITTFSKNSWPLDHDFMDEEYHLHNTCIIGITRNFVQGGGGVQQLQLRKEDTENGDLGSVAH